MTNLTHPRDSRRSRAPRYAALALEALEPRTLMASNPIGYLDVFSRGQIAGWAANADDGQGPVSIEITVNGSKSTLSANALRADLAAPLGSPYHAFTFTMPALPPGNSTILVEAVSTSSGARTTLKSGTLANPAPTGNVDLFTTTRIAGWAHDADSNSPIQVRVDLDGVAGTPFTTNVARNDVAALKGVSGLGFDVTGSFAGKVVEVFALDAPTNTATLLYTNNKAAKGAIDLATSTRVAGWAFDPDSGSAAINVRVDVDGVTLAGTPAAAAVPRNDLSASLGSPNHGFDIAIPSLTPGSHTITLYAVDGQASSAAPVLIATRTVVNAAPVGNVDAISAAAVTGWAFDADRGPSPAAVNVYVDDTLFTTVNASLSRPDLVPIYGTPNHGFTVDLSSLPAGSHSITITAVDDRTSDENEVIIFDDFINNTAPIGALDKIDGKKIYGWAYDADAGAGAIAVDIYVDGVYASTATANVARADIDALLATPNHAYAVDLPTLSFGAHRIDVYASESQGNVSVLIGSKTVTNNRTTGNIDAASATTISGWAADPDRPGEAFEIRLYINGALATTTTTNVARADVAAIAPYNTAAPFNQYGFSITLPSLASGRNQIDLYVVDKNNGLLSPLGSKVFTV